MTIRNDFLPFCEPCITNLEKNSILNVLESNWLSTGKIAKQFEQEFAQKVGAKYAIALHSCTAALEIALTCLNIQKNDEVITSSMTFCSTVNSIINRGAKPIFCDIDIDTGLIDANKIENLITDNTKAILPIHYAGQCADLNKINTIARKYNLKVLSDAAHATGSLYNNVKIGNLCDATAYSFYVTKNLSTGEGGMLTTDDINIYERASKLSLHGMDKDAYKRYGENSSWKYDVSEIGYKCNMSDINASLGLAQLAHFNQMQEKRLNLAHLYDEELNSIKYICPLKQNENTTTNHHLYVIKIDDNLHISRDNLIEILKEYNIGTSVHFIPVHTFTAYKELLKENPPYLPITEQFFKNIISLPLYPNMKIKDVLYVTEVLREITSRYER